ncbi:MAG TPA: glycosyltransferase [Dehalococcoidia bacterium]|nr:glycosyltransferase [Dehalococcoidia bacterium]
MPKVSVVITTYNYRRFLAEAIQSVLEQTFTDFELIIVDDGSTDNTREAVDNFKDQRIKYIYQEHRGGNVARNVGLSISTGKYIAFLDADDIWLPEKLEMQVSLLDSSPDVALVCSDFYRFDDQSGTILNRAWENRQVDPKRALNLLLSESAFAVTSTVLIRTDVITEVGGWDESLNIGQDWELFVRIARNFAFEAIHTPLVKKRQHDARLSSDWEFRYLNFPITLNKVINTYPLSTADRRAIKRRLASVHHTYATYLALDNRITLSRKQFITSIKVDPRYIKPYIYLLASFLGRSTIVILGSCRRRLERYATWI